MLAGWIVWGGLAQRATSPLGPLNPKLNNNEPCEPETQLDSVGRLGAGDDIVHVSASAPICAV